MTLERCNRCGEEFLTEADPYFVEPLKGYELSCTCRIKSFRTQLQASEARERKLVDVLIRLAQREKRLPPGMEEIVAEEAIADWEKERG